MSLFAQASQKFGKAILPIKQTKIINLPVPTQPEPEIQALPKPTFSKTLIFRIPKGIIQESQISPNLLFSLSDVRFQSGFEHLVSSVFRFREFELIEPDISPNLVEMFPLLEAKTW